MSLGLTIISAFSGFITALGLYAGGHVSFAGGVGAYSLTGVLVSSIVAVALFVHAEMAHTSARN